MLSLFALGVTSSTVATIAGAVGGAAGGALAGIIFHNKDKKKANNAMQQISKDSMKAIKDASDAIKNIGNEAAAEAKADDVSEKKAANPS